MRRGGTFTGQATLQRDSVVSPLRAVSLCLIAVILFAVAAQAHAQRGENRAPERGGFARPGGQFEHGPARENGFRPVASGPRGRGGQHLPQWFAQHGGQSPQQQEQALRNEPGFSHLPPGQQQQLINRLHRLDMQPPAARQRVMERNEIFMALPQQQQAAVRRSSQTLREMPPDRQRAIRQAFHSLIDVPPGEREQMLNSARFQAEYSPQERDTMRNLLSIEPAPEQAPPAQPH